MILQLNIGKHCFIELEGISGIKAHFEKIKELKIESVVQGKIEINIAYTNIEGLECFKVVDFDFEFELDEIKVIDVNISDIKLLIVEQEGIDIEYSLVVNYLSLDNKEVILEKINDDVINLDENENVEKIKEDISKEYEKKLIDTLKQRSEENYRICKFSSEDKRLIIKCMYAKTEEDLNYISKEYNVDIDVLIKGFDKSKERVIFCLDR